MSFRYTVYCGLKVGSDETPTTIRKSRALIYDLADKHFEGYSIAEAIGRWRGKQEATTVVTYFTDRRTDVTKVNAFAHAYKYTNNQEAVLIVEDEVETTYY